MNLYAILGVPQDASQEQVTAAYRRLRSSTHPDKGGKESMFDRIQKAYEVLSDPARRALYDANGTTDMPLDRVHEGAAGLFLAMLSRPDPIQSAKDEIRQKRYALEQRIVQVERSATRDEKKLDRILRRSDGPNFLKGILEEHIKQQNAQIAALKLDIKLCEGISALLEGYSFKEDPEEEHPIFTTIGGLNGNRY